MLKNLVETMRKSIGKVFSSCGSIVNKSGLIRTQKIVKASNPHFLHTIYTPLFDSLFGKILSVNSQFCTLSTKPITTTYLNKGVI